ncbi:hypothetical protein Pla175_36740 [Pirellulimonas nuda]|uniref:Uncharacterized protein n=1 Tax=Pirellulimonas nuda TaxID=2528009 RepID=A0A518DFL7_9BACT|nr:hypothetical protein Pla175_36740 [Pirellulimonas nuda]
MVGGEDREPTQPTVTPTRSDAAGPGLVPCLWASLIAKLIDILVTHPVLWRLLHPTSVSPLGQEG